LRLQSLSSMRANSAPASTMSPSSARISTTRPAIFVAIWTCSARSGRSMLIPSQADRLCCSQT
jgi:hypothetical protein